MADSMKAFSKSTGMRGSNKPCLECPVLPTSDPGLSVRRWDSAIHTTADERDPAQQGRSPGKQGSTFQRFWSILLTLSASPSLLWVRCCNSPWSASLCLFPLRYINLVKIYFSKLGNFSQNPPCITDPHPTAPASSRAQPHVQGLSHAPQCLFADGCYDEQIFPLWNSNRTINPKYS